jgi:hypothetical protein
LYRNKKNQTPEDLGQRIISGGDTGISSWNPTLIQVEITFGVKLWFSLK